MSALMLALVLGAAADEPLCDEGGRVRAGLSVQAGVWHSMREQAAVVGDFELRLGYQVSPLLAFYALARGHIVGGGSAFGIVGAAAETTLGNHFFLAVGPVVAIGRYFQSEFDFRTGSSLFAQQPVVTASPGFDLRLGLATASGRPPRFTRYGFTLGFDLLGLYLLELVRGATQVQPVWVFTPMLSLGMDWR